MEDLKVRPVSALDEATEKLRKAIMSGAFQPGERLVEGKLSQRMGVSRPLLREATRRLEAQRLITHEPNVGLCVAKLDWEQVEQIHDVWAMLTGQAAYMFAPKANKSEITQLKLKVKSFEEAVAQKDTLNHLTETNAFFGIIVEGCENLIILELITNLVARINLIRAQAIRQPKRASQCAKELRAIIRAIRNHDSAAARAATEAHIWNSCTAAKKIFDEMVTA